MDKSRTAYFIDIENIDYFIGFMYKSEICDVRRIFEILGPEFGAQRAPQGPPWEAPFS